MAAFPIGGRSVRPEIQMKTKTLDDRTEASEPGNVRVSLPKLYRLQPELESWHSWLWLSFLRRGTKYSSRKYWHDNIAEHLLYGDSNSAIVVKIEPLLIAAYTDEMDCIVLLKFESNLVREYGLHPGMRLMTVNLYGDLRYGYARDILPGEAALGRWGNMAPFIADFLSDDLETIEERKASFPADKWMRTELMTKRYLSIWGEAARDGRPIFCGVPARVPSWKIT